MSIIRIESIEMKPDDQADFLDLIAPRGELFREVVLEIIQLIHDRVHQKGLAADGTPIGTYSNAYMAVRTGDYSNSGTISRGKNKGKTKDSGTVSRGARKGQPRERFNRSSDTSVILSLTRQMENDYAVMPGDEGWGVGFLNEHNFDKATWNDKRYGHTVFDLTEDELEYTVELTEKLITERFK